MFIPLGEGLLVVLGETEILRASEELLAAVDATRGEEFLRADDAQGVTQFRANEVLSPFPSRKRKVANTHGALFCHVGNELRVLVVGMCGDVEYAATLAELAQFLQDRRGGGRGIGSVRGRVKRCEGEEGSHETGEAEALPPDVVEHAQIRGQ